MMPSQPKRTLPALFVLSLSIGTAVAGFAMTRSAAAESLFHIPYPKEIGVISAKTYDEAGIRVGDAFLSIERLEGGRVKLKVQSGYESGAQQWLEAELAPIEGAEKPMLRLLRERSQSFDPEGKPLVILEIDHVAGTASCTPPGDKQKASTIDLPKPDRVANVPLNLLFAPLVEGKIERLETQVFFCLGGARVMRFAGRAVDTPGERDGSGMRKIIYQPNVSKMFNWAAKALAPKILFWFDAENQNRYLAHRLPLYSKGPIVYVVRDGVSVAAIIESATQDD